MRSTAAIDKYLDTLEEKQLRALLELRELVLAADENIEEALKWNMPCYMHAGINRFYIACFKTHLNLGFYKGMELVRKGFELEGEGKDLRHLKIAYGTKPDKTQIRKLVKAAIAI